VPSDLWGHLAFQHTPPVGPDPYGPARVGVAPSAAEILATFAGIMPPNSGPKRGQGGRGGGWPRCRAGRSAVGRRLMDVRRSCRRCHAADDTVDSGAQGHACVADLASQDVIGVGVGVDRAGDVGQADGGGGSSIFVVRLRFTVPPNRRKLPGVKSNCSDPFSGLEIKLF